MLDMLADSAWIVWLILAAVLIVIEILSLDLTFLMLGIGALAAAGASGLGAGGGIIVQVLVFVAVSLLLLFLVRPRLLARMHRGPGREGLSNADRLPGSQCTVLEPVTAVTGLVRLHGEVWSARSESDEIGQAETAYVHRVDGATVIVARSAPDLEDPPIHGA